MAVRRYFNKVSGLCSPIVRLSYMLPEGGWGQHELLYCVDEKQKFLLQWQQKGLWDQPILFDLFSDAQPSSDILRGLKQLVWDPLVVSRLWCRYANAHAM